MKGISQTVIFTDGSSRGNPGPGGWAAVLVKDSEQVIELGGNEKNTTNNRMELTAAVEGLKYTDKKEAITIYTDSSYVINGITKWVHGWKRNGWQTKTKDEVLNRDLWEALEALASKRRVAWRHVSGHAGIVGNERCDHIATDLADGMKIKLYEGPLYGYDLPDILDISHDAGRSATKKSGSSRSRAKAYSYVSSVDGVIEVHHSWAECEKRVKGAKGARYKKALDVSDEAKIIEGFEAFLV